jgi:hypothetical protein
MRLGTVKLRRLHTINSSLSRHKDHEEEVAICPLRWQFLGGNHYYFSPKKMHLIWVYYLYYLGSFIFFFVIIISSNELTDAAAYNQNNKLYVVSNYYPRFLTRQADVMQRSDSNKNNDRVDQCRG